MNEQDIIYSAHKP